MIGLTEELARLLSLTPGTTSPQVAGLVVEVDVRCPGGAAAVLDRVRGLLADAIRHRLRHPPDEEPEPSPFTVDEAYWAGVLPPWFLARTPFASAGPVAAGVWTVEGWLYWFLSADEDRAWRWLSASVVSPERVAVVIQVADLPLAWGALRWALVAAGAASAEL